MGLVVVIPSAKGVFASGEQSTAKDAFDMPVTKTGVVTSFVASFGRLNNIGAGEPGCSLDTVAGIDVDESHTAVGGSGNIDIVEIFDDGRARPNEMGVADGDHVGRAANVGFFDPQDATMRIRKLL